MFSCLHADIWDHTLEANAGLDRDPTAAEVAAVTKMSIAELRQSLAAISALQQVCWCAIDIDWHPLCMTTDFTILT